MRNMCGSWLAAGAIVAVAATVLAISGCAGHGGDGWPDKPGKKILVSFPPLYSFAANVAGEDAVVQSVLITTGPHGLQPTPQDALRLRKADRLYVNGLALDDSIARLKDEGNHHLLVLPVGEAIPHKQRRSLGDDHGHDHKDHKDHKHDHKGHKHGRYDPHVWLGIPEAILMVEFIRDDLKKIDPEHAAGYDRRAAEYIDKLKALQDEGNSKLKDKTERTFVTQHDSLHYFARTFNLKVEEPIDDPGNQDPGTIRIQNLVKVCKEHKIRLVAVEPQYSKSSGETLVQELKRQGMSDAQVIVIDNMETALSDNDLTADFYERKMRQNIDTLAKALK